MTASVRIVVPREFQAWKEGFGRLPEEAADTAGVFFDAAIDLFFDRTQQAVHVVSGALKASGRAVHMSRAGQHLLEGAVEYGDSETVVYAAIENDRGGEHAFFDIGWEQAADTFDAVMPRTWREVVMGWR